MNDAAIGKASPKVGTTNWKRVRAKTDAAVHHALVADPDVTPTDESFWADAKLAMPVRKEPITLRLDADLLAWLRQERGYQTRINAVLRTYMAAKMNQQPTGDAGK
jgi:uncharacterized protein (DUF4415 family)